MDAITLQSVTKTYKTGHGRPTTILNDLCIKVSKGSVFGFLGPNGAGKSTTIKIMLNFIRPDSGMVLLNGSAPDRKQARKKTGYMSEKPCIYGNMTLSELMTFKAVMAGIKKVSAKPYINNLLERVGLSENRDRPVKQFSKGMVQRSSFALALINDPEILILDEPLSGLDPLIRYEVIELLKDIKTQGKTIFFSSHILNDIEKICDEIAILDKGKIKYTGKIDSISSSKGLENFFVKTLKHDK